jgi:hypothetical protein
MEEPVTAFDRGEGSTNNVPARPLLVNSAYGFRPPSLYNNRPRNSDPRIAERRDGGSYPVGKSSLTQRHSPARPMAFRCTHGAPHDSDCLLAHVGDSVVGVVLSPLLLFNLGICFLLFRNELFYGRLWGYCSSAGMAPRGSDRKHYRCADVRALHELPICGRAPARRAR